MPYWTDPELATTAAERDTETDTDTETALRPAPASCASG